jgi:hypothetical protein
MKKLVTLIAVISTFGTAAQNIDFDSLNVMKVKDKPIFNDFKEMLLYNSGNYFEKENLIYGGLGVSSDFLVLDGMRINNAKNFPVLSINKIKNRQIHQPLNFSNSLTGICEIETKKPEQSKIIADVTFPTVGLNTSLFGKDFFSSGMQDMNVELLALTPLGKSENSPSVLFAGKFSTSKNFYPSSKKYKYIDEEDYTSLSENPLTSNLGLASIQTAEIQESAKIIENNNPQNGGGNLIDVYTKLNLPVNENMTLSLGNYTSYYRNSYMLYDNMMFNYNNNPEHIKTSINSFLKWNHEIFNSEESKFNYELQINYQKENHTIQHPEHKDNFFNYGYVGQFNTTLEDNYEYVEGYNQYLYTNYHFDPYSGIYIPTDSIFVSNYMQYTGQRNIAVTFTPSNVNELLSNYTEQFYTFYDANSAHYSSLNSLQAGGALLNGNNPASIYGLWNASGYNQDLYLKKNTDRIQVMLNGLYQFDNHTIQFGIEHNKYTYRSYQINPVMLWTLARQLTNKHILALDIQNPIIDYGDIDNDGIQDTIVRYNVLNDPELQSYFDANLRKQLGLDVQGDNYIDIDSYSLEEYSIEMFSPDELLNDGMSYVSYMGYNPYGEKANVENPYDFYTDEDDGIFTRTVDAFEPTLTSIYGNYEFQLKEFKLGLGIRAERYNANQPVLDDPYLLYEAFTAEDYDDIAGSSFQLPDNIEDDYIIYVDNLLNPNEVVGYRDGNQWYDSNGDKIDEENLGKVFNSAPKPLLKNPQDVYNHPNEDIFIDYSSRINFLPKVHLEANYDSFRFLAGYQLMAESPDHYFIQRSNFTQIINAFNPQYYYFSNMLSTSNPIPNPNLEPIKMGKSYFGCDYLIADLKYKQNIILGGTAVSNTLKNMIYMDQIEYAFPKTYTTYNNSDDPINFWSFEPHLKYFYNNEPSITCRIDYTKNLYSVSEENQDKDFYLWNMSRNIVNSNFSLEWSKNNNYAGLRNLSLHLFAHHRTGFEYRTTDSYSINGYGTNLVNDNFDRIKAYSTISMRIDKGFYLMKEKILLNAYVLVSNLFNRINYFEVYPSTGEPDDDGFLSNQDNQSYIQGQINPEIFKKHYTAKLENPYNFGFARQIKLGIQLVIN